MKKIIAALTLFLAFSLNANAQDKAMTKEDKALIGLTPTEKGKKQADELSQYLGLDKTMTVNFAALFEQKFMIQDDKNSTPERRAELARVVEAKIRGSLDGNQMEKLDKNPDLLRRLIN